MFNLLTASLAAIDVDCTTVTVEVIGVGVDSGKETDHKVGEVAKLKPFFRAQALSSFQIAHLLNFLQMCAVTVDISFVIPKRTRKRLRVFKWSLWKVCYTEISNPPPKPHLICRD